MNISGIVSDKPYSISVVTTVPDRRKTISSLQSRTRMAWAQRKGASGETRSDVDAQSEEISDLLRDITSGTTDILPTGVRIIVWDDVGHDDVPNAVVSHMSLHGLHFQIERNVGNTLFLQSLSLGTDVEYPRDETLGGMPSILSIHTANLLPLWGCYRGPGTTSAEGTLFLNRLGDPVLFDPFDGSGSPHGIVIGQTRSGKSAAVNTILHQILPTGAIAFILDRYGSYEQLCRIHDGKHYAMSIDNPICLGLMDGPLDAAHRATIHAALSEMCTGSGVGNALDAEESALLSVLVQAWVESLTPSSERNLSGFVSSFGELSQEIEGGSISGLCDKLRLLLMPYYGSGDYAAFIDGPNELDLDQQHLVSIDIAGLRESKEIESVLVAMLFLRFTAVVQNPDLIHTPKFMIADEVAFLLESPATGRFFATLARALARFKCSLITVSQLLSDFDSDLGQKIASLSGFRMLFRLSHMENEVMIKHGLSAKARELIRASTRSDTHATAVLTTKTGESGVIRILAPPEFMTQIGQDESHINKREAMECPTSSS